MAVWQITEDTVNNYYIYVSKKGNDSTGSGTTEAPYFSINAGVTALNTYSGAKQRILVVGSGKYINETISVSRNLERFILFYGEGLVCFDAVGTNYLSFGYKDLFYNIEFKNYLTTKYIINMTQYTQANNAIFGFDRCRCYDNFNLGITYTQTYYGLNFNGYIRNSILYFYLYQNYANGPNTINNLTNNVFLNFDIGNSCILSSMVNVKNNVFNSFGPRINLWENTVNYNCLRSNINYNGTSRDLDWIKANTTSNQNSISSDPLFNNTQFNDYTLSTNSPCLYAGENRSHIGAYGLAYSYNGLSPEFSGATLTNISIDENGSMFLTDPLQDGIIETAMITFPKIVKVNLLHLYSTMEFDSNGIGIEIVDYDTGSTEKSVHYDYLIKYGVTEAEWSSAEYKPMLFNKNISIDSSGKGNADDSYTISQESMISLRHVSLKIKMSVIE